MEKNLRMNYLADISQEDLALLPLSSYSGQSVIVEKPDQVLPAIQQLSKEKVLGFDTETKPNFKKGKSNTNRVALLQLATGDLVYLFRLNKMGFPSILSEFLANPETLKIGVAIHEDLNALKKIHPFNDSGFIDLQKMAKQYGIDSMSLKKLTAIVLNVRISKSQQLSNWETDILSPQQITYAATDAWLCREIYLSLMSSI
jgi:ribonuclease D